jgi:hypothetical protein
MNQYRQWDFLIFAILTLFSVLNGQASVFYLIYFFWFYELICVLVDQLFYKGNPNAVLQSGKRKSIFGSFLQMGVYFVFIVVFFGFIASFNNTEILMANMEVLVFQNWFFNANLIFILLERIYLHKSHYAVDVYLGSFTPNMIVLHISIILGAFMMFFVVRNFPDIFTPENLWGSVIIILPFVLLRMWWAYQFTRPSVFLNNQEETR